MLHFHTGVDGDCDTKSKVFPLIVFKSVFLAQVLLSAIFLLLLSFIFYEMLRSLIFITVWSQHRASGRVCVTLQGFCKGTCVRFLPENTLQRETPPKDSQHPSTVLNTAELLFIHFFYTNVLEHANLGAPILSLDFLFWENFDLKSNCRNGAEGTILVCSPARHPQGTTAGPSTLTKRAPHRSAHGILPNLPFYLNYSWTRASK